mgnify:CR=1 FL=1
MNQPELIAQLQQGDEQAFKKLVDEWQDMVYNTVLGIVQNADDADDITQEVFIQVYQSVSSFKGESKLSTWLYRITVTKSLDHLKRKKTKKPIPKNKKIPNPKYQIQNSKKKAWTIVFVQAFF